MSQKRVSMRRKELIVIHPEKVIQPPNGIFIPINVPSSKNSKQIISVRNLQYQFGNSKKPFIPKLINSALVTEYILVTKDCYFKYRVRFHELLGDRQPPYDIRFTFIRDQERGWDYTNVAQIVQDMMVKYSWLPDDSHKYIRPFFDYKIDKLNPGVIIELL